ncbi:MAG TPA: SMC-Scp complex subunit ScpB [Methanomicrobia archaeon]|nr:SMC-Scp complex subunit ScpB [Methanomicrobia archaeon]
MDEKKLIEAVLFAAGRPVSSKELASNLDLPTRDVTRMLKEIASEYEERDGPVTVTHTIKDEYVMQLRDEYTEMTEFYLPKARESRALLKTLALIAYKQPIEQSLVVNFRGTSAYKHLKELEERKLIQRRPKERTYILTTTKEFCELYGLKSTDPDAVKDKFASLLEGRKDDES